MIGFSLCLLPVSFAISAVLGALIGRVAKRCGHVDQPGSEVHKHHRDAIPNTGGIAIMAGVVFPLCTAALLPHLIHDRTWQAIAPTLAVHVPGLRGQWPLAAGLILSALAIHVLGIVDDRRSIGPLVKLAIQCAVAALLVIVLEVRILRFLEGSALGSTGAAVSLLATVIWFAAITNAVNMLDNMDGLAAGVALIIAAIYLFATLLAGQWFVACLSAVLVGSLGGFLIHNFPTARLFMGDSGSLLTGWLLAFISVHTTYVQMPTQAVSGNWYGILMPLIVMAVPLYDLTSVVCLRHWTGRSLFTADTSHFSHRLVARGLSRRSAVMVIWLTTLATAMGGVMLHTLQRWQALVIACQSLVILTMLATLELRQPRSDLDQL